MRRHRQSTVIVSTLAIALLCTLALSALSRGQVIAAAIARPHEVPYRGAPIARAGAAAIAEESSVIDFKHLALTRRHIVRRDHRSTIRPMPNPHSDTMVIGTAADSATGVLPELAAQSPALAVNFLALSDNNSTIPPDTQGTVGPNHLMVTLNSQVRIQSKTGSTVSTVSLYSFWSSMGVSEAFDPRIVFDPFVNRWIFSSGADPGMSSSAILIGVSQTSDPTGKWNLYKIKADAGSKQWADFPTLGFNSKWIVVQANMFGNSTNAFSHSNVWALDKADLYAGGAGAYTLLKASNGFTQYPAVTYDNTVPTEYLLEAWDNSLGQLRMSKITGPVGSEVLTTGIAFPSTGGAWHRSAGVTNFAPQLGTASKIDTDDDRILNCVYRDGALWAAHTIYLPGSGSPTRSAAQWWEINTATGAVGHVLQRGRIDDPSNNFDFAYPTIAVNQFGDAMIGYTRFGASQYASADYAFHGAADAAGSNQGDTVLKAGQAPYFKDFGAGDNRWGDYSNTTVDPANDIDLWTIQEYASTNNNWGTWWGKLALAASPTPTPMPTVTPTPSPTPSATPSPSPTATPSPTPAPDPLIIGASSLADGIWRQPYSAPLMIGGGTPPYNSFVAGGSLPPGISLSSRTGTIGGVALRTGTYSFAVTATDSVGSSVTKILSIAIVR